MKKTLISISLLAVFLIIPLTASAAILNIWEGTGGGTPTTSCNIKPYHCTICDSAIVTMNAIKFLLVLAIIVAVLMIFYGAIRLMTSGGSSGQLSQAKGIIIDALVGLLIVSLAWVMVNTIFKVLTTKTDWNVLNLIGCQGGKFDDANEGTVSQNKIKKFSAPKTTRAELTALENQKEGTRVAPIDNCDIVVPSGMKSGGFSLFTPKKVDASTFGDRVVSAALQFEGKLLYNNDAKPRRDPTGKTPECQALIEKEKDKTGRVFTGCGDCSGFIFKMYGCVAGEDIGKYLDDNIAEVNSKTMKEATLPQGLERRFIEELGDTDEEKASAIGEIMTSGDIIGYDEACKQRHMNGKYGHVMIFDKYVNIDPKNYTADIQIIDHGETGGAFQQVMSDKKMNAWIDCGYIIHIRS